MGQLEATPWSYSCGRGACWSNSSEFEDIGNAKVMLWIVYVCAALYIYCVFVYDVVCVYIILHIMHL